jgi:peroxiredoxin
MVRNRSLRFALTVALALCFVSSPGVQSSDITARGDRKAASDFALTDSHGVLLELSDYKGKVVVLDFWATWCHGCKIEIPWYMEFQRKYQARGLAVIGVSMDEDGWKSVKPYLAKHPISYPIAIGNPDLAKHYDVEAMPVTVLIDREGNIASSHAGMVDKASFESDILTLLRDSARNAAK